jgi:NAD(P)-dependent dehydrogenase (short-subunit alcohol dehydrogenase family)
MQKSNPKKPMRPPQTQDLPGEEHKLVPLPVFDNPSVKGSGKLANKVAFITGADSGIGRAVAVLFAKEGADIAIVYLNEDKDAEDTKNIIELQYGRKCLLIAGDLTKESFCIKAVAKAIKEFERIDILVNNAATQMVSNSIEDISDKQLVKTFETNIFSMFRIIKAAIKNMQKGSAIINTTSVTAYRGSAELMDYAATKGAIVSFTRSLAQSLIEKGIRVNAVAPGPIWTPLIAASFDGDKVSQHGSDALMKRAGEPVEVAPSYLFLASDDSSYITGQVLHPNGGEIVNG